MRAARIALLAAVPLAVTFAGPATLGTGWARLAAVGAALVALALLGRELAR